MFIQSTIKNISKQRYSLSLLAVWTILIILSAIWNIHENSKATASKALIEAETIFQHNLAYRRWNSMHGGVYAKVTEANQPNPYIVGGQRDIIAQDGSEYTLINPFQMTRQAYDLLKKQSPELAVFNRTVSLDPLNSENEPDEWEVKGLEGFDDGKGAISEITSINGLPYMRLMSPYITENRCLGCHEHQGYDVGDIRGGMSVAVPMRPYYEAASSAQEIIIMSHMLLWMLGAVTICLLFFGLSKYQARIVKNEEKFRIVSEFAYNFEYWVNQNKKLAFISPSCERITGYSRKEFIRKSWRLFFDMIHPDDKGMFKNHLKDFEEPVHEDMEYRIITKSGDVRWLSHVCSPIYVDGRFRGRRGSNRDITDNKLLEEDLIQAKKVESLGHFAGGVAHDFNNVLTSISTITQLLKDKTDKENTTIHEYINYITVASKLGQNLTSNLLLFGRRRTTNLKKAKLNKIINNIDNILKVLLTDEIDCTFSLSEKEQYVMVDPHQIEQILINLATNARDAMSNGGQLSIETSTVSFQENQAGKFGDIPAGSYMNLSVSDTGSGINETDMATIFEPFYSTKASTKGTGLGLSIVDNIIKQHKAYIDIDSTLGKGTTFQIFFPVNSNSDEMSTPAVLQEDNAGEEKGTILVVDDDWLIRKSLLIFLQGLGYRVLLAVDGEEAISKYTANSEHICMIVLDVMLPKKDGREVYDSLKRRGEEVPVLFISGSTKEVLAEKLDIDVNFLAKPLDMPMFGEKIEQILQQAGVDSPKA